MNDAPRWWVRVPGSTSNLGPGFDALGMAVDRSVTVEVEPGRAPDAPLEVIRSGTVAELDLAPEDDLIASAPLRAGLLGAGARVHVRSTIPIGRGLGSSAAGRVAGEILVDLLRSGRVDPARVTAAATAGEGHPDNVAPSVHGGLVATGLRSDGSVDVRRLPLSGAIGWGWIAPATAVPTDRARAALPDAWDRGPVVRGLSRLARLIPALADSDPDPAALAELFEDELHVPHRLSLVPGAGAAIDAGRDAGAWAVTVSGAGSGLLVVAHPDRVPSVLDAMRRALESSGEPPVTAFPVRVPESGASWGRGPRPPDAIAPG